MRGFQPAPGHEQLDHRTMKFVATAKIDSGLGFEMMKGTEGIELHVHFPLGSEVMPQDQTREPAIPAFMHKLLAEFIIRIDGAKLLREFDRQFEAFTGAANPPTDSVVGVVEKRLGKHRDGQA